jgi:SAM-dependent methyltransferase
MSGADAYAGHDLDVLSDLARYRHWIMAAFRPYLRGRGVEFGAGIGTMSADLLAHVEHLDLVEPSPNLVARLEARFAGEARITILPGRLEERIAELADGSYHSAVLVNVLEHIEDDGAALTQLRRILDGDGHLLVFVPAMAFLMSPFDRAIGHFRRYHKGALVARLEAAGFAVARARYFDILGMIPWWLVNTVGGRTEIDPRLAALYDRAVVPVMRPIERLVPPPMGKNIIAVARPRR